MTKRLWLIHNRCVIFHFFSKLIFSSRAGALIRRISWLSIINVTISVAAFLIVLFVMNGMNLSLQRRILALQPHLVVSVSDVKDVGILDIHPLMARLQADGDKKAFVFESQDVLVRTVEGQSRGAMAQGITPESMQHLLDEVHKLSKNKIDYEIETELPQAGEVAIGIDLARTLNLFEGDYITLFPPESLLMPPGETPPFERVKVKKILSTNISDLDAQFIFYNRGKTLRSFAKSASRQIGVEVWVKDPYRLQNLKEQLQQFDNIKVETWMDRNSALFFALKAEKTVIGIFLGLAGLIAASSILTVLALLLSQKKRDIAILRTIGLSNIKSVKLFTSMGMLLSASGVVCGAVIGTLTGIYIEAHPLNVLPDIYYDSEIPAKVDYSLLVLVLIVSLIVAFLGSWLPSRMISEIDPSRTLRMKN